MKVVAKMELVCVLLEHERREIADLKVLYFTEFSWQSNRISCFVLQIENLTAGVVMKTSYTEVSAQLQDIIITDMNPETIHPTVSSVTQ